MEFEPQRTVSFIEKKGTYINIQRKKKEKLQSVVGFEPSVGFELSEEKKEKLQSVVGFEPARTQSSYFIKKEKESHWWCSNPHSY